MTDDEREAREWLQNKADHTTHPYSDKCRTILALLDAPRLPKPEDVPDAALNAMLGRWFYSPDQDGNEGGMRAAYRALYEHLTKPAEPVVAWVVKHDDGDFAPFKSEAMAQRYQAKQGGRIVKLVEDRHE